MHVWHNHEWEWRKSWICGMSVRTNLQESAHLNLAEQKPKHPYPSPQHIHSRSVSMFPSPRLITPLVLLLFGNATPTSVSGRCINKKRQTKAAVNTGNFVTTLLGPLWQIAWWLILETLNKYCCVQRAVVGISDNIPFVLHLLSLSYHI